MDSSQVLHRLIEIERTVGVQDPLTTRKMIMELEDFILESQKQSAQVAHSNASQKAVWLGGKSRTPPSLAFVRRSYRALLRFIPEHGAFVRTPTRGHTTAAP